MSNNRIPQNKLVQRWEALKNERSSWIAHWKEISDLIIPRSGRFSVYDRNRGDTRHKAIVDNTAKKSLETLAAGMQSGMTNPARPWFRLSTRDESLMSSAAVKIWLSQVSAIMHTVFQRSNTYNSLHTMYGELGAFGTAACLVLPDDDSAIHHYTLTVGEYCIATNMKGEVDTLYREFQKTVGEIVPEFGRENVSPVVLSMYDRGELDTWITLIHCIEPRTARDLSKKDNKNMPWRSVYFEAGARDDKFLRESGFKRFPALVPRWSVIGGDIYGHSPGMEALGDIKQLQLEQRCLAEAIAYQAKPPIQLPAYMKDFEVDVLPGGITYVDSPTPGGGIRNAFEVNLNLSYLQADIAAVQKRIESSFYADVLLMLSGRQDARMTATEVVERTEERMLMLGPVLERLQNELLDPLIEITFERLADAGLLPVPPQELQNAPINIELVSMLAQAQRAASNNSTDRFIGNVGAVAQLRPEVLDKIDVDAYVDLYAEALNIDPRLILPTDQVELIRQQRAQMQQQQQQMEMASQAAAAAQKLATAPTTGSNALVDVAAAAGGLEGL